MTFLRPTDAYKKFMDTVYESKLIAFAGKSGVGKDTAGDLIGTYPDQFKISLSFAAQLKSICAKLVDETSAMFSSQAHKNNPLGLWENTPKEIAQFVGTDLIRNQFSKELWIYLLHSTRSSWDNPNAVHVITDLRFQDEYEYVQRQGGLVIHIHRDVESRGIPGHVSDQVNFNVKEGDKYHEVINNGTMREFKAALNALTDSYLRQ